MAREVSSEGREVILMMYEAMVCEWGKSWRKGSGEDATRTDNEIKEDKE